jgi:hypothetical protein
VLFCLLSKIGPITLGIISPALNIFTISPILISLSLIYWALCNVADETIEPPIATSSNLATYVILPLLPTVATISINLVCLISGGNL